MFCTQCGSQIPDDSKFCPRCGHAVPSLEEGPPTTTDAGAAATAEAGEAVGRPRTRLVRLLYLVAALAFFTGLAAAILLITSESAYIESGKDKAIAFMLIFGIGLFAAGTAAGFAAILVPASGSRRIYRAAIQGVLYLAALATFGMLTASAALTMSEMGPFYDATEKALQFLPTFIMALLFGGVIAGFAGIVSPGSSARPGRASFTSVLLSVTAIVTFGVGTAIAVLSMNDMGSQADGAEKASSFLFLFAQYGLLYGAIPAGFAGYILYRRAKAASP